MSSKEREEERENEQRQVFLRAFLPSLSLSSSPTFVKCHSLASSAPSEATPIARTISVQFRLTSMGMWPSSSWQTSGSCFVSFFFFF